MEVKNGLGIKQEYVTEEMDYLNNNMCELNVIGNSQSGVVCNSDIGVSEVRGIDYSSSNVTQHHNSENMKKQISCINMGTGVEGTSICNRTWNCPAFCGCLIGACNLQNFMSVVTLKQQRSFIAFSRC